MADVIETVAGSSLHHGKDSDRVYIMKLDQDQLDASLERCFKLADLNDYGKIVAKVSKSLEVSFLEYGFEREAEIPGFYSGREDAVFMSLFRDKKRSKSDHIAEINRFIDIAKSKGEIKGADRLEPLDDRYAIRPCTAEDAPEMASLYREVFKSYPFPIFDSSYIEETMADNVSYYGIWDRNSLVSLASSEMDMENRNTEMTDFATREEYRGRSFPLRLLLEMEKDMSELGIKTAYTISRAMVPGINIVFGKAGYAYGGTLVNNTGIGGSIESMNIWYKSI